MEHSTSIKNIADALLKFDSEVSKVAKTATNPFFKNVYAPLPEILSAIKEPLQKSGLTIKQFPDGEHGLTTIIMHPLSGEWMRATYTMKPSKDDPQGEGSRITYQRRYALGACLGLNIDEDDDGNKASEPAENKKDYPEDNRPWLTDKQFDKAIDRIRDLDTGELTPQQFVEKIKKEYRIKKDYRNQLEEAISEKAF